MGQMIMGVVTAHVPSEREDEFLNGIRVGATDSHDLFTVEVSA